MKNLPVINNETPNFCKGCGGCCKQYAGWYHPEQVLNELEEYKKSKELPHNYVIDCLDGMPNIYVLRPRHTNSPAGNKDLSYGGTCIHHSEESGCALNFESRPMQCQSLIANESKNCKGDSKYTIAEYWKDYQHYFE